MSEGAEYVIVGRIRKPHGVRGELVVEPLTDAPDAFFASGARVLAGSASGEPGAHPDTLRLTSVRPFGSNLLIMFEGLSDRDAAGDWRGRYLFVPAEEVAEPAEGEVFIHELPGMRVESREGVVYGEVVDVYDLPQGLALEVAQPSGAKAMLPFLAEMVDRVDRSARVIKVNVPDGLFES